MGASSSSLVPSPYPTCIANGIANRIANHRANRIANHIAITSQSHSNHAAYARTWRPRRPAAAGGRAERKTGLLRCFAHFVHSSASPTEAFFAAWAAPASSRERCASGCSRRATPCGVVIDY